MPKTRPITIWLSNRWAVFDCPPEEQVALKRIYRYKMPGAEFSEACRSGAWDGYVNLMQRGRVGAGLFMDRRAELEKHCLLQVRDTRMAPAFRTLPWPEELRPYQRQAVVAMITSSLTGGLVLSATGSGKTRLVAEYLRRLIGRACFVVDELALLEQARRELEAALSEKIGVVGKSEFRPKRVTVATIQTLHRHRYRKDFRAWLSGLEVLIIDEIHQAINRRNADVILRIRPKAVFGLTATLQMDLPHVQMPVTALAGPVIFTYPIQQGAQEGYLSQGVVCRLRFNDPLLGLAPGYWTRAPLARRLCGEEKIWVPAGSKHADYRYRISLNRARNTCIEALVREGVQHDRRVVVLVEQRAHLRVLSARLRDIHHQVVCGAVKQEDRLNAMHEMDTGRLPVILANRVFCKGVDIRSVDLIIDATALSGRNGALQRYGRGARKAEEKHGLIYVDIADAGNQFAAAARHRMGAYREIGCPIINITWKGSAARVLDRTVEELREVPTDSDRTGARAGVGGISRPGRFIHEAR